MRALTGKQKASVCPLENCRATGKMMAEAPSPIHVCRPFLSTAGVGCIWGLFPLRMETETTSVCLGFSGKQTLRWMFIEVLSPREGRGRGVSASVLGGSERPITVSSTGSHPFVFPAWKFPRLERYRPWPGNSEKHQGSRFSSRHP